MSNAHYSEKRVRILNVIDDAVLEVPNVYLFRSLEQLSEIMDRRLRLYYVELPHSGMGRIPPSQFRRQLGNEQNFGSVLSG